MKSLLVLATIFLSVSLPLSFPSSLQASPRSPKAIYEIFPRSFQDSNGDGNGDLGGIISRLDYLNNGTPQSLGIDALWLTPIFRSPSYHGYDATDYMALDPVYGDLEMFKKLLQESHRRGIKVYLDMAINHTSIHHPWFEVSSSPKSPDHAFYLWSPQPLNWSQGIGAWHPLDGEFYYGSFSKDEGLDADLNWRNPEVLRRFISIFRYWASLGVDGFRLDAAKFLVKGPHGEQNTPETHQIWKEIVGATREVNPRAYFIGEVWDTAPHIAPYYGHGDELDSCFDFPVAFGLRESLTKRSGSPFVAALKERSAVEPNPTFTSPIINNHDMVRISSVVGGDMNRLKLGAAALLTLPGTPTLYYGDEIGLPEGSLPPHPGDLAKRSPMQWDSTVTHGFTSKAGGEWNPFSTQDPKLNVVSQMQDPKSLLNTYRNLLRLRVLYPVLADGVMSEINESATGVVTFIRNYPQMPSGPQILVAFNFSNNTVPPLSIPVEANLPLTSATVLLGGGKATIINGPAAHEAHVHLEGLRPSTAVMILLKEGN